MNTLRLSRVTMDDLECLQDLSRQTFFETFAAVNTEENMRRYLEKALSTEKLAAELLNPDSEFYFAWSDDALTGYMKLNVGAAQTEPQDGPALEIERIYVRKEYHGKQVGQILSDLAVAIARERKMEYVWLGVWEENTRAIAFYQKNGFTEFGTHVFMLGDDAQTDILMKKKLE